MGPKHTYFLQPLNTNIALYLGLAKEGRKHTDAVNIQVSQQADYRGKTWLIKVAFTRAGLNFLQKYGQFSTLVI